MYSVNSVLVAILAACLLMGSPARAANGADDPPGHVSGGKGADDPADSTDDRGRRIGPPREGTDDRGRRATRLADDNPGTTGAKVDYRVKSGLREFKAGLKIHLPDAATGLKRSNARTAVIAATLAADGAVYAECQLVFDHFLPGDRAEYKLAVSERSRDGRTTLRQNRGGCDIDLTQAGMQAGVPSARSGDAMELSYEPEDQTTGQPSKTVELGRGTF